MGFDMTIDISASACLACHRLLDAATSIEDNDRPKPGDVTVCWDCGHIMFFADDLSLRNPTDQEMYYIAGDKRILAVQRLRRLKKEWDKRHETD